MKTEIMTELVKSPTEESQREKEESDAFIQELNETLPKSSEDKYKDLFEFSIEEIVSRLAKIPTKGMELNLSLGSFTQLNLKFDGDRINAYTDNNLLELFLIAKQINFLNKDVLEQAQKTSIRTIRSEQALRSSAPDPLQSEHPTWPLTTTRKCYEIPTTEWRTLNITNEFHCNQCGQPKKLYQNVKKLEGVSLKTNKKYSFFPRFLNCGCDKADFKDKEKINYLKK